MALREFKDSKGTAWTAWDVPPHRVYPNARSGRERRTMPSTAYQPERRSGRDRRREVLHPHLQAGWVCFTSGREKRRLYPPPPEWHAASEEELEALLTRASFPAQ